jgi:hypothetical protein
VARLDLIKELILLGFITLIKNKCLEPIIFNISILLPSLLLPLSLYSIPLPDLYTSIKAPEANSILLLASLLLPQLYPNVLQLPLTIRLIGEVAKIYTKEQKYNRFNSNFNYKLTIFLDIC